MEGYFQNLKYIKCKFTYLQNLLDTKVNFSIWMQFQVLQCWVCLQEKKKGKTKKKRINSKEKPSDTFYTFAFSLIRVRLLLFYDELFDLEYNEKCLACHCS